MLSTIFLSVLCSTAVSALIIYPVLIAGSRDDHMVRVSISKYRQDRARLGRLAQIDSSA